jgi:hypothetical protein
MVDQDAGGVVSVALGVETGHDGQRGADGGVRQCRKVTTDQGVFCHGEGTV